MVALFPYSSITEKCSHLQQFLLFAAREPLLETILNGYSSIEELACLFALAGAANLGTTNFCCMGAGR